MKKRTGHDHDGGLAKLVAHIIKNKLKLSEQKTMCEECGDKGTCPTCRKGKGKAASANDKEAVVMKEADAWEIPLWVRTVAIIDDTNGSKSGAPTAWKFKAAAKYPSGKTETAIYSPDPGSSEGTDRDNVNGHTAAAMMLPGVSNYAESREPIPTEEGPGRMLFHFEESGDLRGGPPEYGEEDLWDPEDEGPEGAAPEGFRSATMKGLEEAIYRKLLSAAGAKMRTNKVDINGTLIRKLVKEAMSSMPGMPSGLPPGLPKGMPDGFSPGVTAPIPDRRSSPKQGKEDYKGPPWQIITMAHKKVEDRKNPQYIIIATGFWVDKYDPEEDFKKTYTFDEIGSDPKDPAFHEKAARMIPGVGPDMQLNIVDDELMGGRKIVWQTEEYDIPQDWPMEESKKMAGESNKRRKNMMRESNEKRRMQRIINGALKLVPEMLKEANVPRARPDNYGRQPMDASLPTGPGGPPEGPPIKIVTRAVPSGDQGQWQILAVGTWKNPNGKSPMGTVSRAYTPVEIVSDPTDIAEHEAVAQTVPGAGMDLQIVSQKEDPNGFTVTWQPSMKVSFSERKRSAKKYAGVTEAHIYKIVSEVLRKINLP